MTFEEEKEMITGVFMDDFHNNRTMEFKTGEDIRSFLSWMVGKINGYLGYDFTNLSQNDRATFAAIDDLYAQADDIISNRRKNKIEEVLND